MRYLKVLFFVTLAVALVSGTALAGSLKVNQGAATTPFNVASETLGTNRTVTIAGTGTTNDAANFAMTYTLGTALAAGDLLNLTLTGALFPAGVINVCSPDAGGNAANLTGNLAVTSASNNITVTVGATAANAGNFLVVTGNVCNVSAAASVKNLAVTITSTPSKGFVTGNATLFASGGTLIKDSAAAAANVANILSQYSYGTITAGGSHTIDYLTGAKNGSQFTGATNTANTAPVANVVTTTVNFGVADVAGLAVADLLNISDTQNFQGISRVYIPTQASGCTFANNIAANNAIPAASTSVNFTIAGANISTLDGAAAGNVWQACIDVTGNVAVNPRTFKITPDINVTGTGSQDVAAGTQTVMDTWGVNAFQAVIPYLSTTAIFNTICVIDNIDTSVNAGIVMDLVSSTSGTTLSGLSLGTVNAMATKRIDFSLAVTPFATGSSETAQTPITLTGMTDPQRYAARLTITANPNNIHVNCIQLDPAGSKRAVPVLKFADFTTAGSTGWIQ